jgi:hypothetical protein
LNYNDKEVYLKYVIAKIKKGDISEDLLYDEIKDILKKMDSVSYNKIAKICIKYQKNKLAEKLLNMEKSDLEKIPLYIQLKMWDKALELCLKNYDINLLNPIIDKIYNVEGLNNFTKILSKFPQAHNLVIDYLKNGIKKPKDLDNCFQILLDKDELFFNELEKFFQSENIEERRKCLFKAKEFLNGAKNIDLNFYKTYIDDLENSLKLKENCLKKEIIGKDDEELFDNSTYDFLEKATPELLSWVESQNNQYFGISKRKMTILQFNILAKNKKFDEIDDIIKKVKYKKLDINALKVASIMLENENEEKALEYAKKETNTDLFENKFEFILKLKKYLDAVEVALSEKRMDLVHNVLKLKPELRDEIEKLCNKYKVRL